MVEVLSGPERRRTPQGKIAIIQQTIRFLFIKKISSNIISWGVNLNGLFFILTPRDTVSRDMSPWQSTGVLSPWLRRMIALRRAINSSGLTGGGHSAICSTVKYVCAHGCTLHSCQG
ncbi:hypothetical protein ACSTSJ_004878 [Salmonella enterica subsp. enterica serovar Muenchen]